MDDSRFDPLDYLSAFNRRKWWFIVPVTLSIAIGLLLVWRLPRTYQSAATVGISSPRVAANVVSGSAAADKTERQRAISQQLLSRDVLERVVREEHLDGEGRTDAEVSRLRRSISVAPSASITPGSTAALSAEAKAQLDSYELSYLDSSAEAAQRILNRIAHVFVDVNSRSREMRAQDTSAFIETQLAASDARLHAIEAKLRDAKETYMGRLPEQTHANLQMVSAVQRQLESSATSMRGEQDRLSMIERQLQGIEQGAEAVPMGADPAAGSQARVLQLRNQLAEAQLNFTDKHPEVIRLRDELATAERAAAAERTRPLADRRSALQMNPDYRQLLKDRDTAKLRIAELQRQQSDANAQIRQYQFRVEAAPRVEQELASLQREYDLERTAYADLTQKKQVALLNENLLMKEGGEQFSVLAPASFPAEPFAPKPMRVMLMALAVGLVIGGAGVVGREYLDRSVHNARGLRDEFELLVLAEIPRIEPAAG